MIYTESISSICPFCGANGCPRKESLPYPSFVYFTVRNPSLILKALNKRNLQPMPTNASQYPANMGLYDLASAKASQISGQCRPVNRRPNNEGNSKRSFL